jgi:hypothetical protein
VNRRIALALSLLLAAGLASAQERSGQLSKVAGGVTITGTDGKTVREAKQVGPRVINGSLFGGEVLSTDDSGAATLLFSDGTSVDLKPKTRLTVQEMDFSALQKAGKKEKPFGRKVRILAGNVFTKVAPNPQIATEFETPSGVAAVKGTEIDFAVEEDGSSDISTTEGVVDLRTEDAGLQVDLVKGNSVSLRKTKSGLRFVAGSRNVGALSLRLPNGETLSVGPGSALDARIDGFAVSLAVESGDVLSSAGAKLGGAAGITFAHANFAKTTAGTPVTVKTEEGSVDFLSNSGGIRMTLDAGNAGTLVERPNGQVKVSTPKTNATTVQVEVGGKTTKMAPGGTVTTDTAGGTPQITSGQPQSNNQQAGSNQQGQKPPQQVPCGDCSVPDGAGGCKDVDALCPNEICSFDRKCQGGRCVGGRRPTSKESPDCK